MCDNFLHLSDLKNRKNIMNCSLKNLHKSLKIRIFGYGSEQRTANSEQRTANSEQRTANSEHSL